MDVRRDSLRRREGRMVGREIDGGEFGEGNLKEADELRSASV